MLLSALDASSTTATAVFPPVDAALLMWSCGYTICPCADNCGPDTCLCEVIANYESLTDPPELWMSECGLVLSVMQLGITDRLLQEAQASLGEVHTLHLYFSDSLYSRPQDLFSR